jgi:hypothetical protein
MRLPVLSHKPSSSEVISISLFCSPFAKEILKTFLSFKHEYAGMAFQCGINHDATHAAPAGF